MSRSDKEQFMQWTMDQDKLNREAMFEQEARDYQPRGSHKLSQQPEQTQEIRISEGKEQ